MVQGRRKAICRVAFLRWPHHSFHMQLIPQRKLPSRFTNCFIRSASQRLSGQRSFGSAIFLADILLESDYQKNNTQQTLKTNEMSSPEHHERRMANTDMERLIIEVQSRECMWNRKLKSYLLRKDDPNNWISISKTLGFSVKEVKSKWKYLFDNMRKIINKMPKGSKDQYTPSWKYYERMKFVIDQFEIKEAREAARYEEVNDDSVMLNIEAENVHDVFELDFIEGYSETEDEPPKVSLVNGNSRGTLKRKEIDDVYPNTDKEKRHISKREQDSSFQNYYLDVERERLEFLKSHEIGKDSENILFFKSLLGQMEKLPYVKQIALRGEIFSLVYSAFCENESQKEAQ